MKNLRTQLLMLGFLCMGTGGSLVLGVAGQWRPLGLAPNSPHSRWNERGSRARGPALALLQQRPLSFEENQGQTVAQADFLSRGRGYTLLLGSTGVELTLATSATLGMEFVGANPDAAKEGLEELPGRSNYFFGDRPSKWRTNIATYGKVRYTEIYPGVDLVYYGDQGQLEYDFVVAPGADPERIALRFAGVDRLAVDSEGGLLVRSTDGSSVRLRKPLVYQSAHGGRRIISANYVIDENRARVELGSYDRSRTLVIDPVLLYSTRLGGSDQDAAYAIAVDRAGYVYVTGDTDSRDFPVAVPAQGSSGGADDIFVAKLSPDGSQLIYSTYLGGSEADVGAGITVDSAGNVYLTGDTSSPDFPVVTPIQRKLASAPDAFVAKLSPDGSHLIYSTYLGGGGGERGMGIAVDRAGQAYVAGYTHSTDFSTENAFQPAFAGGNADAFIAKLSPSGSALVFSTYLGGGNDRPDIATAIAVDSAGNAFVTGFTNSRDFPVVNPLQSFAGPTDVFVTKLSPLGVPIYSTFLGGIADDEGMSIAVDSRGSAYITGETESLKFPTTAGAFRRSCVGVLTRGPMQEVCSGGDAFVAKLDPAGSSLVYSTYVNGTGFEVGRGIAVGPDGSAYVTGITSSADFPMVNPIRTDFGGGKYDAFVFKLNPSGTSLSYATYLGGGDNEGGYGIAVDGAGNAYVAGFTASTDFPSRNSARNSSRKTPAGIRKGFITKIGDQVSAP